MIVRARVNNTEDECKVERAIKNVFPEIKLSIVEDTGGGRVMRGESRGFHGLSTFRELLRRDRIRAAARSLMLSATTEGSLVFNLNKQAAFAGRVSFASESESPLGPITVELECPDPVNAIGWLTQSSSSRVAREAPS
ncbi:MAG: RNA-binding domain-containing protein [Candidatus Bathyarchaeia archaeon]